ncbi:MAG: hypothetical protein KIT83_03115 [Bryobacterales bacterium]|nr:hypothetical protein [Bryobacterales bacterium]
MLTLVPFILSLAGTLAATVGFLYLLRQSRKMRAEIAQYAVEIEVLHEKLKHGYDSIASKFAAAEVDRKQLTQDMANLFDRFDRVEMHAGICVPPKPAASGFNINKRVEVIRLFKEGFVEDEIAEQLAVPLGEVRLLTYLQKVQAGSPPNRPGRGAAGEFHAA